MRISLPQVRKAFSAPRDVVAFRLGQLFRIQVRRRVGTWPRIDRSIRAPIDEYGVRQWGEGPGLLVASEALARLHRFDQPRELAVAESILDGGITVFGVPVECRSGFPWHEDWRFGHRWAPGPFEAYDFYEPRTQPYDIKFPWELGRLGFVVQALAAAPLIGRTEDAHELTRAVVTDWLRENPIGGSSQWHPMEASMRAINLVCAADLLRAQGASHVVLRPTLEAIALNAEFVLVMREYSDLTGNHYAANVGALALAGLILEGAHPRASAWAAVGLGELAREILCQHFSDGHHLEGSTPYHRLVVEIFGLAALAAARRGRPLEATADARLRTAAAAVGILTRPDGACFQLGDSDDATALSFDEHQPPRALPTLGLGAVLWPDDRELKELPWAPTLAQAWLGGVGDVGWRDEQTRHVERLSHLDCAGIVVGSTTHGSSFAMDIGPVGQRGRGGHGQNDILSFEWWLDGALVVADPGTASYSGDRALRELFRSSAGHNTVVVDGQESSRLVGVGQIRPDAMPVDVRVDGIAESFTVACGHRGYERLSPPVGVRRTVEVSLAQRTLRCLDVITGSTPRKVERFLHLPVKTHVEIVDDYTATFATATHECTLRVDHGSELEIVDGLVSPRYGTVERAPVLVATNRNVSTANLTLDLRVVHR